MQCGEPELNLYSPQDNSFETPARKTKKIMISSSTISSPDASCSAWFSVDHGNEPECFYKNDNNSAKLLTNECVSPASPIKNLSGKKKNKKNCPLK